MFFLLATATALALLILWSFCCRFFFCLVRSDHGALGADEDNGLFSQRVVFVLQHCVFIDCQQETSPLPRCSMLILFLRSCSLSCWDYSDRVRFTIEFWLTDLVFQVWFSDSLISFSSEGVKGCGMKFHLPFKLYSIRQCCWNCKIFERLALSPLAIEIAIACYRLLRGGPPYLGCPETLGNSIISGLGQLFARGQKRLWGGPALSLFKWQWWHVSWCWCVKNPAV